MTDEKRPRPRAGTRPRKARRIGRFGFAFLLAALATALAVVASPIPQTDARSLFLRIVTSLIAAALIEATRVIADGWLLQRRFVRRLLRVLLVTAVSLAFVFAFWHAWRLRTLPFPTQGTVADFVMGPGGVARTALGTQFSIVSDSAWNLASKCWYERIADGEHGRGYLRLYYQLSSPNDREPYVGIYAGFSPFSAQAYDVSRFHALSCTIRVGQPLSPTAPITVALLLYSENVRNPDYAFPVYYLSPQQLSTEWVTVSAPLSQFKPPRWVNYAVELDPRQVFRFGILILGQPRAEAHGHVDVRDICFSD